MESTLKKRKKENSRACLCRRLEEKLRIKQRDSRPTLGDISATAKGATKLATSLKERERMHMLKNAINFRHVKVSATCIGSVDSFFLVVCG